MNITIGTIQQGWCYLMFNFFKKPKLEPDLVIEHKHLGEIDKLPLASITYYIGADHKPIIDIGLEDYSADAIDALCKLLDTLSNESIYIETINMLKQGLIKDQQEEVLLTIFTHISQQARYKIANYHKESIKDEPCIKPSDML